MTDPKANLSRHSETAGLATSIRDELASAPEEGACDDALLAIAADAQQLAKAVLGPPARPHRPRAQAPGPTTTKEKCP